MPARPRPFAVLSTLVAAGAVLSACGPANHLENYHPPVRVPYNFQVDTFMDARPDDPRRLSDLIGERTIFPFHQDDFLRALVGELNKQMFVSDRALLKVQLLDYATFTEDGTRTVAFHIGLEGRDEEGTLLASGTYSCLTNSKEKFDIKGAFESLRETGSLDTTEREARRWLVLYRQCLARVAHEFNSEVDAWITQQKYAE